MIKFIARKFLILITSFIGVTLLTFTLIKLSPADPVTMKTGERGFAAERYQMLRDQYGFDDNLVLQYGYYVKDVLSGDLWVSSVSKQPVLKEFFGLVPATIELAAAAILFALLLGIPLGVVAAMRRNTWVDYSISGVSLVGYSMPVFWWGMLLVLLGSLTLGWTPVAGRLSLVYDIEPVTGFMLIDTLLSDRSYAMEAFWDALHHLALPALVLGTIPLAAITRMTRAAMLSVLKSDYIRTARAKGVSNRRIIWVHAFRNALIPILTVIGLQISALITGAIVTEIIFSWPGVGKWIVTAINQRDYSVVQNGVLLIAASVILLNLFIDLLYGVVNPRIRN